MNPRKTRGPSAERIQLYRSLGFELVHNDTVNINPSGVPIEVDFSAVASEYILQVAIQKAFDAGRNAGEEHLQTKVRHLLGIEPSP